jgi:hypothetical protein
MDPFADLGIPDELRAVLRGLRWGVGIVLLALAAVAGVVGFRIPIEAGGLLFAPMLFGFAGLAGLGGQSLLLPRPPRRRTPRRWR